VRDEITEKELLSVLRKGVRRSSDLIAQITEYHGGPVTTEYMLTSDIARQLIEQQYEVKVEYLNRSILNAMTVRRTRDARKEFGSRRTDVAVLFNEMFPLAIIEVKIGVKTLRAIEKDLVKITDTIDALKPQYASRMLGAAVFQVHVAGSEERYTEEHFRAAIAAIEKTLGTGLAEHGEVYSGYDFSFHCLQPKNEGYTPRDIELDDDGYAWGQHGHATRYYAVLIKSRVSRPKPPTTFVELKAYMQR
jgi:hypothetical protein